VSITLLGNSVGVILALGLARDLKRFPSRVGQKSLVDAIIGVHGPDSLRAVFEDMHKSWLRLDIPFAFILAKCMRSAGMHEIWVPRVSRLLGWPYLKDYTEQVLYDCQWSQFENELMMVRPEDSTAVPILRIIAKNDPVITSASIDLEGNMKHNEVVITEFGSHCQIFSPVSPSRTYVVGRIKTFLQRTRKSGPTRK